MRLATERERVCMRVYRLLYEICFAMEEQEDISYILRKMCETVSREARKKQ
jgi:hypothetical protein